MFEAEELKKLNKKSDDLMNVPTDRRMFRDRLLAKLSEQNISQAELARKSKLSKDAISTYTTMRSLPGKATLARIAAVLKCKPTDLIPQKKASESLLEMRDHSRPGYKLLVVKMPLKLADALHHYELLARIEHRSNGADKGDGRDKGDGAASAE